MTQKSCNSFAVACVGLVTLFALDCAPVPESEWTGASMLASEDPVAMLVDPGPDAAGVGPVVFLRALSVDADCQDGQVPASGDCLADEEGGPAWLDVRGRWSDFVSTVGNAGEDPGHAYAAVVGLGALVAVADTPAPGPADVAAAGVLVIGGVTVTVLVAQALVEDPAIRASIDALLFSASTSVAGALESVWLSARGAAWQCDATCNLEGNESWCWDSRSSGGASGSNQSSACREAKRVATQSAPRGCYARHCSCTCWR